MSDQLRRKLTECSFWCSLVGSQLIPNVFSSLLGFWEVEINFGPDLMQWCLSMAKVLRKIAMTNFKLKRKLLYHSSSANACKAKSLEVVGSIPAKCWAFFLLFLPLSSPESGPSRRCSTADSP